ncbi:MAG: protein translocase subunit SecD [Myxococcales bacterium]|nr:protein translocase subunit SecD [Myxococcales bacterium]MCB9649307.1 protein translocase subunit SecD [Deltaproteobacteria bacterium]
MERSWYWRLLLVLGLMALAVYYSIPSGIYFFSDPDVRRDKVKLAEAIPDWLPKHRFNLGIDLQGGLHLVMGVDTDKAVQDRADRVADEIVESMQEKGVQLESCRRDGDVPEIHIVMKAASDWETLKKHLEYREDTWTVRSHFGNDVIFGMKPEYESTLRDDVVAQAQKTVRNRIDVFGVKEPEVRRRGANSILIQIAGLTAQDQEVIKNDIIGRTAQLEFKIVDETSDYFKQLASKPDKPASISLQDDGYEGKDGFVDRPFLEGTARDELKDFLAKYPPPTDRVVGIQEFKANPNAKPVFRTWLLDRRTPITGDALTDAFVAFDNEQNNYYVAMKFDRKGAVIFEKLTRENTKRKMAIVLDDVVDSAPIIQGPIPGGNAQITLGGYKSQQEIMADARALSVVLKAGALPAPLYPQEQRTVGATLGDDAVAKGKNALFFAGVLVVILMIFYYRGSGVAGAVALGSNLLFLFAALSAFDATLTLPGIAGLALTIGMAVDANIIQFERIREELRAGKTSRAALDSGFDKAFSAIFDANVTTFLAAVVLLQYGSGPIRGFATTLALGVVINTFTAVVVPKLLLDWYVRTMRPSHLSI